MGLTLTGIICEDYKPFAKPVALPVRPLTVLIGKNNSGKSALARLPLLLFASLKEQGSTHLPLDVGAVEFGASFPDLVHRRLRHGSVQLGLTFLEEESKSEFGLVARVQHFDEFKLQFVTELEAWRVDGPRLRLEWAGEDPLQDRSYLATLEGEELGAAEITFAGVFPEQAEIRDLLSEKLGFPHPGTGTLGDGLGDISHFGPFRDEPQRSYKYAGQPARKIEELERNAPQVLGSAEVQKERELVRSIGQWFADNLETWPLAVDPGENEFSLVLQDPRDPTVKVNLADAGTGLTQILPLVVKAQLDQSAGRAGALAVVEQPELHLHPAAHAEVAQLFIDCVKLPGARFLVETHSENFLLRIRRAVASKDLDPDKVALYWVAGVEDGTASHVTPIKIKPNGAVEGWPSGVFTEGLEEIREIREANRGGDASS